MGTETLQEILHRLHMDQVTWFGFEMNCQELADLLTENGVGVLPTDSCPCDCDDCTCNTINPS